MILGYYGDILKWYVKGTKFDPTHNYPLPTGRFTAPPADTSNERAYKACRNQLKYKNAEKQEHDRCICISTRVRFDKFTEEQLVAIEQDLWAYEKFGPLRVQMSNRKAGDSCFGH